MKITKCPYCGRRLSYFNALMIRTKGEYFCKKCGKESNIYINKKIFPVFFSVLIISLLVTLYFCFFSNKNLFLLFFVILPYVIFYLCAPYFVNLKPMKKYMDTLYSSVNISSEVSKNTETLIDHTNENLINTDIFNIIKSEKNNISDSKESQESQFESFEEINSSSGKTTIKNSDGSVVSYATTTVPLKKKNTGNLDETKRL